MGDRDREVISVWALGVIACVAAVGALARYFVGRDNLPPMERHVRALDALRNLAQEPRPVSSTASETAPPDVATDHVRILADVPDDERRTRRAPTPGRRSTARPAWVTDLPTIAIRPAPERPVSAGADAEAGEVASSPVAVTAPFFAPGLARDGRGTGFRRSRAYAAAAAAAAVVVVGTLVAIGINGRGTEGAAAPKVSPVGAGPAGAAVSTTSTSTTSTTVARATPVVTRTTAGATVTLAAPFVLTLRTSAPCWIQITDTAGAVLFTDTLPADHTQPIPGAGTIVMKVGNMAGVTITVDGVDLALGGLPQAADITFRTA